MASRAQRRALKRRLDAPFVPGSALTNRDVAHDRNAELALRYGPAEKQLGQRQQNVTHWFDQYKADLAAKGQQQAQMYQQAVAQTQQQAAQSQQAAADQRARLDAEARADAASRGATYSGIPGLQSTAGAETRKGLADLMASLVGAQGAATTAYTADQSGVASASQLSEHLKGEKALEDLLKEKGAYGQDYMAKRRDAERQNVLENLAFGLKEQAAQVDAQDKLDDTNKWGYTDSEWAAMTPAEREAIKQTTASYGKTPKAEKPVKLTSEGRKVKATIRRAVRAVQKQDNGLPSFWDDAYDTLIEKDGLDPVVARAVVQGARVGRIGKKTAQTLLEDYGIDVKTLGLPKPAKRPAPYTPNQTGRPSVGPT